MNPKYKHIGLPEELFTYELNRNSGTIVFYIGDETFFSERLPGEWVQKKIKIKYNNIEDARKTFRLKLRDGWKYKDKEKENYE
tara:strand:+ start:200 stop:448 length:249 start_codon:yes stop_codon:yes gene_type:complete